MDEVIKCFGLYSGKVLTYFTHRDGPWSKYKSLEEKVIPSEDLDEYAKRIKEEYNIKEMNDIHLFSEALFEKYKKEYNLI